MSSIEAPNKELSPEEKKAAIERNISVEIERRIMEKYAPLEMVKNSQMTLEEARSEWIKDYAIKFRKAFDQQKAKILELYHSEDGLEKAADYIENDLVPPNIQKSY